jgi:hypothetical protein
VVMVAGFGGWEWLLFVLEEIRWTPLSPLVWWFEV